MQRNTVSDGPSECLLDCRGRYAERATRKPVVITLMRESGAGQEQNKGAKKQLRKVAMKVAQHPVHISPRPARR